MYRWNLGRFPMHVLGVSTRWYYTVVHVWWFEFRLFGFKFVILEMW